MSNLFRVQIFSPVPLEVYLLTTYEESSGKCSLHCVEYNVHRNTLLFVQLCDFVGGENQHYIESR